MITKVRLVNWRSHLNSELDFTKGTNALLGHMGAGKTSILDSICFALFGTFPILQSKKLKLDDVIMKRPIEKDRAEVEVQFNVNNSAYSVKRVIERHKGTTHSEVRENGKLLESPSTQRVNELIEKILKVDYELFSKAIYSEQNALDYFLTIPKGQRMKKIDELLLIHKFEETRANAISLINKMLERKLGKQSVVDQTDLTNLQRAVSELKENLNKLASDKQLLQAEVEKITSEKVSLDEGIVGLRKVKENFEILKREESGIASTLLELSRALSMLENNIRGLQTEDAEANLKSLNRAVNEFEAFIFRKRNEYQKLQEQAARAKAEAELMRKEKIERLDKEIREKASIKRELDKLQGSVGSGVDKKIEKGKLQLEKFVGEVEALKIKVKDLQETLGQLSSLSSKCPVCERKLTLEKKQMLVNQKEFQIKSLMADLGKAIKQRESMTKELKQLESAAKKIDEMLVVIKDFDKLSTELENSKNIFLVLNENSMKLEKELKSLQKELENSQEKLKETVNNKQQLEILLMQTKDYKEKKRRFDELARQRDIITKHISELETSLSGATIDMQENIFRNLIAKEKELSTKIDGTSQLIEERKQRFDGIEKMLESVVKEKKEIEKLETLIQQLKIFEVALGQTQIELRKEFITSVNYAMNNIWNTLYPYQDFTGIRLSIEEGDYVLQLKSRAGEWINAEGLISGGERSLAALALRISFALVLAPQLRFLVLDEPTANLDSRAVGELSTTLRERIHDFIDQTFLITHQAELEDAVTGNAYYLERDKAIDGPTKIIQVS